MKLSGIKIAGLAALLSISLTTKANVCETEAYVVKSVKSSNILYVHNETGAKYSLKLPIYVSGKVSLVCSKSTIKIVAGNYQTGLSWGGQELDAPRLYYLAINIRNPEKPLIRALEGLDGPKDLAGL